MEFGEYRYDLQHKEYTMRLQQFVLSALFVTLLTTVSLFARIENWDIFEEEEVSRYDEKDQGLPLIVIVREDTLDGRAINVYVDGEYLTSLLPGAYTVERICPGKHRIRLAYTNVLTRYKEKDSGGQFFAFPSGSKQFFSIVRSDKTLMLKSLTAEESKYIHKNYTKRQHHTISRISKRKCAQKSAKHSNAGKRK
jgi:hypothetical protein